MIGSLLMAGVAAPAALDCLAVGPAGAASRFQLAISGGGAGRRLGLVSPDAEMWATGQKASAPTGPVEGPNGSDEYRVETASGRYVVQLARASANDVADVGVERDIAGVRALNIMTLKGICRTATTAAVPAPAASAAPVPAKKFTVRPITVHETRLPSNCRLVTPDLAIVEAPVNVTFGPAGSTIEVKSGQQTAVPDFRASGASLAALTTPEAAADKKLLTVLNSASAGDLHAQHSAHGHGQALDQWLSIRRLGADGSRRLIASGHCAVAVQPAERG